MKPAAYYNEIDPFAAQWLRNLIAAGHIAPGDVDERSIVDVKPDDLKNYTQCHFFAGLGGWSYAMRRAGWSDDRPAWTGSCPCQPYSLAGKRAGKTDERHLAPAWLDLIEQCQPTEVFGEQVAAAIGKHWLDDLFDELEKQGYACGATVFPSCGVGAPHIRHRLWFVARRLADANGGGWNGWEMPSQRSEHQREDARWIQGQYGLKCRGEIGIDRMADADLQHQSSTGNPARLANASGIITSNGMANANGDRSAVGISESQQRKEGNPREFNDSSSKCCRAKKALSPLIPRPINGFWLNADWLYCRDEKWRPVEPQSFPLVARFAKGMGHGKSSPRALAGLNRTGRLKGYGNAINIEAARAFIEAYMGVEKE